MTPRILIVGDILVDEWLIADRGDDAPEPRVPRYRVREQFSRPGGAANVARQLSHHDCFVYLLGFLDDEAVRITTEHCGQLKGWSNTMPCGLGRCPRKHRLWDGSQIACRWDDEQENYGLSVGDLRYARADLLERARSMLPHTDALVISDYHKGTLDANEIEILIGEADNAGVPMLVDPCKKSPYIYRGCTVMKCNAAYAAEWHLSPKTSCIVTHGDVAPTGLIGDQLIKLRTTPTQPVRCVVGAGDCFMAHLALAWGRGQRDVSAVAYADRAARAYCQLGFGDPVLPHEADGRKVLTIDEASRAVKLRHTGKRIIAACGCFDVLHPGHLRTLQWARNQGDVLIVLVNDDAGVRALKGPERPLLKVADRAAMLAGVATVDYVVPFEGISPISVIEAIKPTVLVKGPEWLNREEAAPEAGIVRVIAAPDYSFSRHSSDIQEAVNVNRFPAQRTALPSTA